MQKCEYVLGIDSGGTHYRVLALSLDGAELAEYSGSTASIYYLERHEMIQRIRHHLQACIEKFGGEAALCRAIVCGSTGIDSDEDAAVLHKVYAELPEFDCPVYCVNDAELAHYAVTGGEGMLMLSGTGAIAFGRNQKGDVARAGGWLFSIMGDEGSGAWVSRQALRHLARWFDGTVPDGPLAKGMRQKLHIETRKQLMDFSHEFAMPPWQEPKLGPLVNETAEEGDHYALEILYAAARETFTLASSLVQALHLDEQGDFLVGIWGSNILKSRILRDEFVRLMAEHYPMAKICLPQRTAQRAAADLALEKLGIAAPGKASI